MYSYENGLKGKNIGFAKVEAKDGQCKVLLSLKGVYPVKRSCKVYFFHRTVAGMEGILLGDMGINNGIGEQRFYTSEKNIMNSNQPGVLPLFIRWLRLAATSSFQQKGTAESGPSVRF